ncbi:hypothetical protein N9868_00655 [Akkermansiaceae bacterium]|nr:hypothetical protein [Akkermansiaceae bacterium]MDB4312319.1 hypothetical protein [bacterium]MDB4267916.1 hypothetical protein [Akkermansiaceae bacterium]MDB4275938.1 hypothetical protein [Akkermansiaceae bacterium]MDB4296672.1 hypothetical protein [Akkermansiaceae bacterium]
MKKLFLPFLVFCSPFALGVELYNADFSVDGQGSTHDSSGADPVETSPVNGANWLIRWDVEPATDSSGNKIITEAGKLVSTDWGGESFFETAAVDVSALGSVVITTTGITLSQPFSNSAEYFQWTYSLDGAAPVVIQNYGNDGASYDGAIDITEVVDVSGGNSLVVGFAFNVNGGGDGFEVSTVRVDDEVPVALSIALNPTSGAEDVANPVGTGTVNRAGDTSAALEVTLVSSDETELTVPAVVTILAGQGSASFDLTVVDDVDLDGDNEVSVTASAAGFVSAGATFTVLDNEMPLPQLSLSADPTAILEAGGTSVITVDSTTNPDAGTYTFDVTVSDGTELSAPATFVVTGASATGSFTVTGLDDVESDGSQPVIVTLTEQTGAFQTATITIMVTDDEAVSFPPFVLNEIRIDQFSNDNDEYFELYSTEANASLDRLSLIVLGDSSAGSGSIEAIVDLDGQTMNGNFFLAGESSMTIAMPDFVTNLNFENGDNVTFLLVSDFSGSLGDDLDIEDDGVLDSTPWGSILDGVGLIEEANPPSGTEYEYATALGFTTVGPFDGDGILFPPPHTYKNGQGEWVVGIVEFTNDTPGAINPDGNPPTTGPPTILSLSVNTSNGEGEMVVTGLGIKTFVIEASATLGEGPSPWVILASGYTEIDNPDGKVTFSFTDATIPGLAQRFYRISEAQ